jgi:hypothetical protein
MPKEGIFSQILYFHSQKNLLCEKKKNIFWKLEHVYK